MRFVPKTAQEIESANLLDPGLYDFEVMEAEDKVSKAGNDMVALGLRIEDHEGRGHKILDWLVSTDGGAYKVRHFAESVGLLAEYEKGDMPAGYMIGKTGRCKITIKAATAEFGAKNAVADYVGGAVEPPKSAQLVDDEIPF
jgi:hypothetical protein